MLKSGEDQKEAILPEFNQSIMRDFQGAKITSDVGFLLLREIDERFGILGPVGNDLADSRSPLHTKHSLLQMVRQRVYQIAAGYEDCNDADFLRIDPALRLAIGKGDEAGDGMFMWLQHFTWATTTRPCFGEGTSLGLPLTAGPGVWYAQIQEKESRICSKLGIGVVGPFS